MAEPTTPSFIIAGAVATALGPVFGPGVLIAFGAVAGSMLALSKATTSNWRDALKFILVGVFIAIAITGAAAAVGCAHDLEPDAGGRRHRRGPHEPAGADAEAARCACGDGASEGRRAMNLLLLLQVALAAVLMGSSFFRLIKTNASTVREIRWSIWLLFVAAGLVLAAPVMPLLDAHLSWPAFTTPVWAWLVLLLAILLVQLSTSRHWRDGAPSSYQKD
jgi:magnesium-transporting ATPase (P-type)